MPFFPSLPIVATFVFFNRLLIDYHLPPMSASVRRALLGGATLLTLVSSLPYAQKTPERPSVKRGADRNDWEAYYDLGIELLQSDRGAQAEAAFFWASRLRPDRAEPLYARWIAFWVRDSKTFDKFEDYLRGDERVLRDPQVQQADSLRYSALRRSPFVHQGLLIYLYDHLPGRWKDDQITAGWIALGQGKLPMALERFGRLVAADQKKYGYLRFVRASAFANSSQFDSAAGQLSSLLTQLRGEDDKTLGSMYQSKELLEFALGLLHQQMRRTTAAKEAFGRAVAENAAFAPAHAALGRMAIAARDSSTALVEFELAVETEPNDVVLRIGYGQALLLARRPKEAAAQFQKAVELEPYYAEPVFFLATALEGAGDAAAAKPRFGQFLELASRSDPHWAEAERKK